MECLDLAVEVLDEAKVRRADFVGISTPMHTAIRLGVKAGELVRGVESAVPHLLLRALRFS